MFKKNNISFKLSLLAFTLILFSFIAMYLLAGNSQDFTSYIIMLSSVLVCTYQLYSWIYLFYQRENKSALVKFISHNKYTPAFGLITCLLIKMVQLRASTGQIINYTYYSLIVMAFCQLLSGLIYLITYKKLTRNAATQESQI